MRCAHDAARRRPPPVAMVVGCIVLALGSLGCDDADERASDSDPPEIVEQPDNGNDPGDGGPLEGSDRGPPDPSGAETVYYVTDHTRSIVAAVDARGRAMTSRAFDAYGMPLTGADAIDDWGFSGNRRDPGSGLVDFGARQFSARLGRFYDVDPIMRDFGREQAPLRYQAYTYAASDPVNLTDAEGEAAVLHAFFGSQGPNGAAYDGLGILYEIDDDGFATINLVTVSNPGIENGTLTMYFEDEDADQVLGGQSLPTLTPSNDVFDSEGGNILYADDSDVTVVRDGNTNGQSLPTANSLSGRDFRVRLPGGTVTRPFGGSAATFRDFVSASTDSALRGLDARGNLDSGFQAAKRSIEDFRGRVFGGR